MRETQVHYRWLGVGLCQNRRQFVLTDDRRQVTCKRCLAKLQAMRPVRVG